MGKVKLFLASALILAFPLMPTGGRDTGLTTAVLAGHTGAGHWCECGCPGCICEPGEQPTCSNNRGMVSEGPAPQATADTSDASEVDYGAAAMMLGVALLMLRRYFLF